MTADERIARALSGWAFGEPLEKLKARLVSAVEDAEKEERKACIDLAEARKRRADDRLAAGGITFADVFLGQSEAAEDIVDEIRARGES